MNYSGNGQGQLAMGDHIARLPTSSTVPHNANDEALVGHLFGATDKVDTKAVANYIKGPLLVAVIVGVLCFPQADDIIERVFPASKESPYYKIMIKMVIAAVVYYILNNWALSRQ
jgi:Na+-driven multidrug efflux pump